MHKVRVFSIFLACILLVYLGCIGGDNIGSNKGDGLNRCKDCDELERFIKSAAIKEMEHEIWENFTGGYDDYEGDDDGIDDDVADDDSAGDDDSDGGDGNDYSGTNVQEEGVDEADLIKTDGKYLYYLNDNRLLIFKVWPAHETAKIAELEIGDYMEVSPIGIFLYKSWVLVLGNIGAYELPQDVWPGLDRSELYYNIVKMLVVDVSEPAKPTIIREMYVEGDYISSRRINQSARIVIYTHPYGPDLETWVDPSDYYHDGEIDYDALWEAYQELMEANREKINNAPLEEFLPRYYDIVHTPDGDQIRSGQLSQCEDFYLPEDPIGRGILSVITIVLDDPTDKQDDIAVVADGTLVYASKDNLFVTADFNEVWEWGEPDRSQVHMFDIHSNPEQAIYLASGWVEGWVLNQFSMSEYNGFLRIATTKWQGEDDWWGEPVNQVLVLKRDGGSLEVVGTLPNIASGEDIYAVRFLGERGFIVTFRQTDPLFTIDLSNPYNPKLVGELQIPGFSNYIHPMGKKHLLTVGENGDEDGWTWGVALNIFDVSDFAHPELIYHEEVGGYDSYSPAQYDHHAFLYFQKLLSIPLVTGYYDGDDDVADDDIDDDVDDDVVPEKPEANGGDGEDFCGFYVYRATPEKGFERLFIVDHRDTYYNEPRRSAIIEEYLYTVSSFRLIVTDLEIFEDVVEIEF